MQEILNQASTPNRSESVLENSIRFYYGFYNQNNKQHPIRATMLINKHFPQALNELKRVTAYRPVANDGKGEYSLIRNLNQIDAKFAAEVLILLQKYGLTIFTKPTTLSEYKSFTKEQKKQFHEFRHAISLNFPKGLPNGTLEEFLKLQKSSTSDMGK